MAAKDRTNNTFAFGTILNRVFDKLLNALVVRFCSGEHFVDRKVSVAADEATVIDARPGRILLEIQVQGSASAIRITGPDNDPATEGELLDAAPETGDAGGMWWTDQWDGEMKLQAVTGSVDVNIREIF